MSCLVKMKVNNKEELVLELPDKNFLEGIRQDGSLLVNIAQELVKDKIHTVELVGEILENNENNPPNVDSEEITQNEKIWTDDNTKQLIELCKTYDHEFQTGIKKTVWNKIAEIMTEQTSTKVTGVQCDTKWKGLQKQYKIITKHNETSGSDARYWKFYNTMHEILHKKPEIKPLATCSSAAGLQINDVLSSPKSSSPSSPSTSYSSSPTSSVIRKRKITENSVERRHQEKLQRQDRFLNILENIMKKMDNKKCSCTNED